VAVPRDRERSELASGITSPLTCEPLPLDVLTGTLRKKRDHASRRMAPGTERSGWRTRDVVWLTMKPTAQGTFPVWCAGTGAGVQREPHVRAPARRESDDEPADQWAEPSGRRSRRHAFAVGAARCAENDCTKFGCGIAQSGACTVQIGGEPVRSCLLPASAIGGQPVITIEAIRAAGSALKARWDTRCCRTGFC
jgi:hypothetical protein